MGSTFKREERLKKDMAVEISCQEVAPGGQG